MKLQLQKKKIKALSQSKESLANELTPQIAGGNVQANWTVPAWRCQSYLGCVSGKPYC